MRNEYPLIAPVSEPFLIVREGSLCEQRTTNVKRSPPAIEGVYSPLLALPQATHLPRPSVQSPMQVRALSILRATCRRFPLFRLSREDATLWRRTPQSTAAVGFLQKWVRGPRYLAFADSADRAFCVSALGQSRGRAEPRVATRSTPFRAGMLRWRNTFWCTGAHIPPPQAPKRAYSCSS